jgi:hypothetical protein
MLFAWKDLRWVAVTFALFTIACSEEDADSAAAATPDAAPATTTVAANSPPAIFGTPIPAVPENIGYMFAPTANDPDGDPLIFGIDAKPSWAEFNTSTGQLSGTPAPSDVGIYRGIIVWVSDGESQALLPPFDLTVVGSGPANSAPTISGTPAASVLAGSAFTFTPTAADADGDRLVFSVRNRPSWATFTTTTGRLRGTPQAANAGTYSDVVISVTDGSTTVALTAFSIAVTLPGGNSAPTILGTPLSSVEAGSAYAFVPTASDADGDSLTFSISGRPAWASFNAQTGALTGTPSSTGTFNNVVISVSDGTVTASLASFSIAVTPSTANAAPLITGAPATSATEGVAYSFQAAATDADNDALTFTIANRPTWATFDTTAGRLQGTPGAAHIRTYNNIVIGVNDGKATAQLPAFSVTVAGANVAPTITGTPATAATVGTQYAFQPTADDANGNTLTFGITNRPTWATFNASTGRLQGTPAAANVGSFANIRISVSDGQVSTPLPAFTISVTAANVAPTISGTPAATATTGVQYAFQPTANDANGNTLTFSITNRPAWATFSTTTGRLQGAPAAANVGTFANIGISVSDGQVSAALPAFTITVSAPTAANNAPTISGLPATVAMQGVQYTFQPTANDTDGDVLTFSIMNRPAWATFTTSNGRLQGTPGTVGTTTGIVISVTDGEDSAALAAFSIAVQAVATGSATLSWTPPTLNSDGSPLTNLAGFKVYWGTSQNNLASSATINNPGITSYMVENLVPGTYFFATTAFNSSGTESDRSNTASKTIQ